MENGRREPVSYIVACKFYRPIKLKLGEEIEIAETEYEGTGWSMARQEIDKRPKAAGRQLRLFEETGIYKNYRYS